MKNMKLFFIGTAVVIISFLFGTCSTLDKARNAEEKGKYEEALNYYFKDLEKNPGRIETKDSIKKLAEMFVPTRIDQGNAYLAKEDYFAAWTAFKSVCFIITEAMHFGIPIQGEQQYERSCREAKEEIAAGLYRRGKQFMNNREYRLAYQDFRVIKEIFPTGYQDVDQLMDESIVQGQVRIAVIIRTQPKSKWIADIFYPQIKEKIIKESSPFLTLVETNLPRWSSNYDEHYISQSLIERKQLDVLAFLSLTESFIKPDIKKEEIKLCYASQNPANNLYSGKPVKASLYTKEKTLSLAVTYEFIDVRTDKVIAIKTVKKSNTDKVTFTKVGDADAPRNKKMFASNCPDPREPIYHPTWYPEENFVEKPFKSDEDMVNELSEDISDIIVDAMLTIFDRNK